VADDPITTSLAPWLQSNPWDPSTYGGQGQFGAAMLANAGPTPYRVPFLAALGKGMQAGQAAALNNATSRMQAYNNALGLNMTQMRLPMLQAYYQALMGGGLPGAGASATSAGAPQGAPANGSQASPNASADAPAVDDTTPTLLRRPADQQDQEAATSPSAPWMPPTSGAAPTPAGTPEGGGTPPGVMNDPMSLLRMATFGAAIGAPGSDALATLAKTQLQYDPRLAATMEAAKSAVGQDQVQIQQALAAGNVPLAQALAQKWRQDMHLLDISRNGIQTRIDPATGAISTFDPTSLIQTNNGAASLIPGGATALGGKAAAESLGRAQGETVELSDAQGNKYTVPKAAVLPGGALYRPNGATSGTPGAPGSNGAPTSGLPLSSLGPAQAGYLAGRGKESADYVGELQKAADTATDTNYSLDQILADAKNASLGPAAPTKEYLEKGMAAIGQIFGLDPPQGLTTYQQLEKYSNKIAFSATRAMGAREAAQIVHLQIQSNPNKTLTPDAFNDVALSMKALNNYLIAKNDALQAAARANGGDAMGAAAQWTRTIDPRVWDLTLSPVMGKKWAATIGAAKISAAYQYLTPDEQQALLHNIPQAILSQLK
jgi:hypothetical protein